jgi:hypothetical protein
MRLACMTSTRMRVTTCSLPMADSSKWKKKEEEEAFLGLTSALQCDNSSKKGPKGKHKAAVDQDDASSFHPSLESVDRVSKKQLDTQGVSQQPRPRYFPVPTGAHVTESSERSREKGAKADVYRKLKRR